MQTKYILTTLLLVLSSATHLLSASYIWTGSSSTNWNTAGNWSSGIVPVAADYITLNSNAPNNLVLDQNRTVANFTINGDTLDLGTYTLTTTGVTYFNGGLVSNGNLNISGSLFHFGGATINARIEASCGYYHMNGGLFLKPVVLVSSGTSNTTGTGNCTFEDSLTINHSGVFYFTMGSSTNDFFNGPVTITNHASKEVYLANGDSSFYNANVTISSTGNGGVAFGNGGGVSVLASGKTISIGSGGFGADYLTLKKLKQIGTAAQTLTLTGTAIVNLVGCEFNGNLTLSAGGFLLKDDVFNSASTFTKTGTANCHSDGNNTYNGATSFANNGSSGRLRLSATEADVYSDHVSFNSTGQDVQVCYTGNNYFYKNVTINSNKVVFNTSTGKVTLAGDTAQSLNGSYNYAFKKLAINKNANHVTANTTLSVDDTLFFVSGNLITTSTNLLTMKAGSKVSGASSSSFMSGPVKKIGNTAFQFPVGKNNQFRSVEITAPTNATDAFTAEYFDTTQALGSAMDTTITFISDCGYWNLSRTAGTSNITPKFAYDSTHCDYLTVKPVHITFWDGTKWTDKGEGVNDSNTKKTNAAVSSYGNFALAYKLMPGESPQMPYELTSTSTCNPVEMLFENSDLWFSFEVDSALIKLGIFAPDPNKWYVPLKELIVYENYNPGADLISVMDWQMDCDSSLFSFQTFSTALDTSKKYLAKFSKYEMGDCDGISDTTNYYLNICLRNLRMFTSSISLPYYTANDLLNLLGTPLSSGLANVGDVLIPGSTNLSIDVSNVAPLVIDRVILSGDYDLLNNPTGTLLTSGVVGDYFFPPNPAAGLQENGYMFIMKPGSIIQNLRLRGAMPGFQDFNKDEFLCAGIKLIIDDLNQLYSPFDVLECEISNFSYAGIFAGPSTDIINIDKCYIHHILGGGGHTSAKGYGIWLRGGVVTNVIGCKINITNCIFDECKEAVDAQPNPRNITIESCTFSQYFLNENINKHRFNNNPYERPNLSAGPCDYYLTHGSGCSPSNTGNNSVGLTASGHMTIIKNIFHQKSDESSLISLPYPATEPIGSTPSTLFNIAIKENTFAKKYDSPGSLDCNFGGFARMADNYVKECIWDFETTYDVNGNVSGTTNPPILINSPNQFSYVPGSVVTSSGSAQPPEVNINFTNAQGLLPGFSQNSQQTAYYNINDNINLDLTHGTVGSQSQNVTYIVRAKSGSAYNSHEFVTPPSSANISLTNTDFNWSTNLAGLYGVDAMAIDGNTTSKLQASRWEHAPVIVAPTNNYKFIFNIKDSYYAVLNQLSATTEVFKQIELNGHVIWKEDIADGGDDWERIELDLMNDKYPPVTGTLINTYIDPTKLMQTLTFSIAIPNPSLVSTVDLKGVFVWVDDVYLKKYDSPENLIRDGDVENSVVASGLPNAPSPQCIWYQKNTSDLSAAYTLDSDLNDMNEGVDARVITRASSVERKSGQRAIIIKLDGVHQIYPTSTITSNYGFIIPPMAPNPVPFSYEVISAAFDFDYRDFLGCSDYAVLGYLTPSQLTPVLSSPISTTVTYSSEKILLDNDIEINANGELTLAGCQIAVLENSSAHTITVNSGGVLNIINDGSTPSRIFACGDMWQGIIINNGGRVNIYTSGVVSEIYDAITAIDSDGGIVDIRNALFDHNYIGLNLHDGDFRPSSFSQSDGILITDFKCSGGKITKQPFAGEPSAAHIILTNVTNIQIGGYGASANDYAPNTFSDAVYGIKSLNSNAVIYNNVFEEMQNFSEVHPCKTCGTAIYAINSASTKGIINIGNVLSDAPYANVFSNLPNSIILNGNIDSDISENQHTNVNYGVFIKNNITGDLTLRHNTFINSDYTTVFSGLFQGTAITFQNYIASAGDVEIIQNEITDFRYGIHAINVPNIKIGIDLNDNCLGNIINFNLGAAPSLPAYYSGIWAAGCNDAFISNNEIENDVVVTSTGVFNFRGIEVENSLYCRINSNIITNLPRSMYFTGDCNFTKLRKNQFTNYEHAVELFDDQTILPPQGEDPGSGFIPYDNEWVDGTSGVYRTYRNSPTPGLIAWYYDNATNGAIHDPKPTNTVNDIDLTEDCDCDCNTNTRITDRDRSIGQIINDSISFSVNPDEFCYQTKMNVFLAMKADSTLIYQGFANDSVYLNFYNAVKYSNINRLDSVTILTTQLQTEDAILLNEDIADSNYVEYYMKIVTGIYLNGPAQGIELSSSDSTTLETIAHLPVSLAGRAVYAAAAMLGLEVHQEPGAEARLGNAPLPTPEKPMVGEMLVYPNPSNSKVYFNFKDIDFSKHNNLRIYDNKGKLILQQTITVNLFEFNVSSIKPGIYRFMFGSSNSIIFKGNFAVIN